MAFRFRRRVKLLPGVALNLSKSGISTSIGGKGATLNISKKGTRATVGLPGTGLSYQTKRQAFDDQASPAGGGTAVWEILAALAAIIVLISILAK